MRRGHIALVVVTVGVAVAVPAATVSQPDTLETVLARAGQYVTGFEQHLAGIVAEEHYAQELQVFSVNSGSAVAGMGMDSLGVRKSARTEARRYMKADVLLLRPEGATEWVQYRDAFDVDGQQVRSRSDRLAKLFERPTPAAAEESARIDAETAGYHIGGVSRSLSVPVRALVVLDPAVQPRFRFKRRSSLTERLPTTRLYDVPKGTWLVEYDEAKKPTLVRINGDKDLPIHGRLWIEPATGRVLISELIAEDRRTRATILVSFQSPSPPLFDLRVPVEMRDEYEGDASSSIAGTATYTRLRPFPLKPIGAP